MNLLPNFAEEIGLAPKRRRLQAATAFLRRHRWFMLFVALPVALAALYYGLVASDQYISQSRFIVKSPGQRGAQVSTLASLIQTTGLSRGQEETNSVLDYIRSRNALSDLEKRMDVRAVFSNSAADRLSRYPFPFYDSGKFENLYDYYQGKVETHLDNETGLAVLSVRAFDAAEARRLNAELLTLSEELVNRLNERAHAKQIEEAERRVREAEARVRTARVAMGRFRNSQDLIDPAAQATGIYGVVMQLTTQRAAMQAQLDQMVKTTPGNPAIPNLRGRIASVGREIDALAGRVVGNDGAIASKLGGYENLLTEQMFATEMLTAASASLEQARTEAQKQQFYLERVVEPDQPDLALYPKRLVSILTIAGAALCLYFIGWMLVVGILEHSPED
jgi:capsular polysaccharide transport system permease protein